ncbi:unnamed protein product, partial [Prunus brigantina]
DGNRREARRRTAWPMVSLWEVSTDADFLDQFKPMQRFLVCPESKVSMGEKGCRFFQWFDAEMCEHSKSLIPGLLRKIDRVEKENAKIRAKSKILWAAMLLSWLVVFAMKMN